MKNLKNQKNVIVVCYADCIPNDLVLRLEEIKKDYNFDIITYKVGEPSKDLGYDKKVTIIYAEHQDDLALLQKDHEKCLSKIATFDERVVLISPNKQFVWKDYFNAEVSLTMQDKEYFISEIKKVLDREFKGINEFGKGQQYARGNIMGAQANLMK